MHSQYYNHLKICSVSFTRTKSSERKLSGVCCYFCGCPSTQCTPVHKVRNIPFFFFLFHFYLNDFLVKKWISKLLRNPRELYEENISDNEFLFLRFDTSTYNQRIRSSFNVVQTSCKWNLRRRKSECWNFILFFIL